MRLKILVVPFSIIFSLILVIGFIQPDITTLQEKRVSLDTKTTQAQSMTTLLSNIDALAIALDNQQSSEKVVGIFLPQTLDQERAIDTLNFLASQSGVVVSDMNMQELQIIDANSVAIEAQPPILNPDGTVAPPVPNFRPKVKSYTASISVAGSYENIKDFFNRVGHMNRYHKIRQLNIEVPSSDVPDAVPGQLKAILETQFDYFPGQKIDSALNIPVFASNQFASDKLNMLLKWINISVPSLSKPDTGRQNPFQP
ncbi:MAG: hypothetical protein KBA91_00155 [Candidatus Moranbacteria bacterium]|nr:hypothetical protein [Candidatus Moranbacteria bacterium]